MSVKTVLKAVSENKTEVTRDPSHIKFHSGEPAWTWGMHALCFLSLKYGTNPYFVFSKTISLTKTLNPLYIQAALKFAIPLHLGPDG